MAMDVDPIGTGEAEERDGEAAYRPDAYVRGMAVLGRLFLAAIPLAVLAAVVRGIFAWWPLVILALAMLSVGALVFIAFRPGSRSDSAATQVFGRVVRDLALTAALILSLGIAAVIYMGYILSQM